LAATYVSGETPEIGDVVRLRHGQAEALGLLDQPYRVSHVTSHPVPSPIGGFIRLVGVPIRPGWSEYGYMPERFELVRRKGQSPKDHHHEDECLGGAHDVPETLGETLVQAGMTINGTRVGIAPVKDTNPKTIYGQAKSPLHLVPEAAIIHMAEALRDGEAKYGAMNWRIDPVSASTYYAAARRHLAEWWDGENFDGGLPRTDPDYDPKAGSGIHHLAHAATNLAILLDAMVHGSLIDDRPPACPTAELIRKLTREVPRVG
jgi:hypothetical protein